jgi:hypothetical protein
VNQPADVQSNGVLLVTLTRPDRSVVQPQKTTVSTFGITFYRGWSERFYRQGVPTACLPACFGERKGGATGDGGELRKRKGGTVVFTYQEDRRACAKFPGAAVSVHGQVADPAPYRRPSA